MAADFVRQVPVEERSSNLIAVATQLVYDALEREKSQAPDNS